jgi:type I restriction enzyme R subunit
LREALLRLNAEIAAQPDRADEVIYALRATVRFDILFAHHP